MSNIRVNTTELLQLLDIIPASHNLMLVGRHGIGKSEILTEYFSAKGMPVVALFLGQMADPGDLIGIPNKNTETGKTEFMPPYWFIYTVSVKVRGGRPGSDTIVPVFFTKFAAMKVDCHCHILPGLDDGAQTLEDSVFLAGKLVEWDTGGPCALRTVPSFIGTLLQA